MTRREKVYIQINDFHLDDVLPPPPSPDFAAYLHSSHGEQSHHWPSWLIIFYSGENQREGPYKQ